ncbi:hypothetical protein ABEB36_004864 [Hypothenemus hampei]|uniref:CHK kinase-like domain-containing protein n=1 Tax=Hypothenemus hampei TaxID=57062 RepID=A0ABD1EW89_HYPHA
MNTLSTNVEELVNKVTKENDFKDFNVEVVKSVSNDGDGYIGILQGLCIRDKNKQKELNLVIKEAPRSVKLRSQFPTREAFIREIYFYKHIYPGFTKFQEKYQISNPFNNVANFYGSCDEDFKEILLLENLKTSGYRLYKKTELMDSEHLTIGFTAYARFHAISHAMKHLEPETFRALTKEARVHPFMQNPKIIETITTKTATSGMYAASLEAVKDKPLLRAAIERAKADANDTCQILYHCLDDESSVLVHADCWNTNLLFKYQDEKSKIPLDIKLIDWQICQISTPIYDLSYFLFINADKKDLYQYSKYLKHYYAVMKEILKEFGLELESFYPYDLLDKDFKKYCKLGFFVCQIMMQQATTKGKTHDFVKMADEGQNLFDVKTRTSSSPTFQHRMSNLIEFLVDNGSI